MVLSPQTNRQRFEFLKIKTQALLLSPQLPRYQLLWVPIVFTLITKHPLLPANAGGLSFDTAY